MLIAFFTYFFSFPFSFTPHYFHRMTIIKHKKMHSVDAHEEKKPGKRLRKGAQGWDALLVQRQYTVMRVEQTKMLSHLRSRWHRKRSLFIGNGKRAHIQIFVECASPEKETRHRAKCIVQSKWSPMSRQDLWYSIKHYNFLSRREIFFFHFCLSAFSFLC